MWERLRKNHPGLYKALEWLSVALALGAFLLTTGDRQWQDKPCEGGDRQWPKIFLMYCH